MAPGGRRQLPLDNVLVVTRVDRAEQTWPTVKTFARNVIEHGHTSGSRDLAARRSP